ncbi:MAG: DinB family protein [Flavobacteriales bacterium]|nr:DinB family protein [Flavobacteriales bacterium]
MATHNFDDYFKFYTSLVDDVSIDDALKLTNSETQITVSNLSEDKGSFAYAEGKWTIKQLLCHCIDTERIFCARALRFARNDSTDLPGYDHDDYVNYDNSENRKLVDILAEMKVVREATIHMFNSFPAIPS